MWTSRGATEQSTRLKAIVSSVMAAAEPIARNVDNLLAERVQGLRAQHGSVQCSQEQTQRSRVSRTSPAEAVTLRVSSSGSTKPSAARRAGQANGCGRGQGDDGRNAANRCRP